MPLEVTETLSVLPISLHMSVMGSLRVMGEATPRTKITRLFLVDEVQCIAGAVG